MKVLYCAPGSGLGHLNRALAICLALRDLGVEAQVATNSPFAEGVARAAQFPVTGIADWAEGVRAYAAHVRPRVVVCDTFPRGLRGEWAAGLPGAGVYVARRLNAGAVARFLGDAGWREGIEKVVAVEELSAEHESALGSDFVPARGRVRLRPGLVRTAVPAELERLLDTGRCQLVVHGGPLEELRRLVARVDRGAPAAALTPWGQCLEGIPCFEYWPAGNVLKRVAKVLSGAGYNIMSDMMDYPQQHEPMAFFRKHDDQAGRLAAWRQGIEDATMEVAGEIAALVR